MTHKDRKFEFIIIVLVHFCWFIFLYYQLLLFYSSLSHQKLLIKTKLKWQMMTQYNVNYYLRNIACLFHWQIEMSRYTCSSHFTALVLTIEIGQKYRKLKKNGFVLHVPHKLLRPKFAHWAQKNWCNNITKNCYSIRLIHQTQSYPIAHLKNEQL